MAKATGRIGTSGAVWIVLAFLLAACQPAPLSIEEARTFETNIGADATPPPVVTPPRTVTDILTLLKDIKPDPSFGAELHKRAEAQPPPGASGETLAAFLYRRGVARSDLGDTGRAAQDLREAVRVADEAKLPPKSGYLTRLEVEDLLLEDNQEALELATRRRRMEPRLPGAVDDAALAQLFLGDLRGAEATAAEADRLAETDQPGNAIVAADNKATLGQLHGRIDEAHGRFAKAEREFREAIQANAKVMANRARLPGGGQSPGFYERRMDVLGVLLANSLSFQRRYAEAEAAGRDSLMGTLRRLGATSTNTARAILSLAEIISRAGRHAEAAQLVEKAIEIDRALGLRDTDAFVIDARVRLAAYDFRAGRYEEAGAGFAAVRQDLLAQGGEPRMTRTLGSNTEYALSELRAGRPDETIAIESRCVANVAARLGEDNFNAAICRGFLATALAAAGRRDEALAAFRASVPIVLAHGDDDPGSNNVQNVRAIVEAYLRCLGGTPDSAAESFYAADALRSRTGRSALAEATARMRLPDPGLAELARREQDIGNERQEYERLLLQVASAPPDQQDKNAQARLRQELARLGRESADLRKEISTRFPRYTDLVTARGATVDEARGLLRGDEALVAITALDDRTLVWAFAKDGPLAYASAPMTRSDVAEAVAALRRALDPHVSSLGEIPPFDVALAHRLYQSLIEPVSRAWQGRTRLVVVADGPLAALPLSVLVTRAVPQPKEREGQALFAGYRAVPFLVREVAVTQLPSAAALTSLRQLPPDAAARRPFVGFGDPWFNAAEAQDAKEEVRLGPLPVASRGTPVLLRAAPDTRELGSARISQLPRLPDTAGELRQVAAALGADPARDVFLGSAASEETVETVPLVDRRVVMFATHGLVPGDLDGLTQPALALSPPAVAGGRGDGLLTAEKILGLKLDADWVVLSACNTAGDGAQAISGLGGAFFYTGARALLVTNWPVETVSARLLTTGTFRHQGANPTLSRAAALRLAELDLIDGPGAEDESGRTLFSYADPLFWAPYSLIGDGG